jgi:hypothetical protein
LYDFSSIYKKVMKLFIHPNEGYEVTFKPLNRRLCLVTSLGTGNSFSIPAPQLFGGLGAGAGAPKLFPVTN